MDGVTIESAVASVLAQTVNALRLTALEQGAPARRTETASAIVEMSLERFRNGHGHGDEAPEVALPPESEVLAVLEAECRRWAEVRLEGELVAFATAAPPSPFDATP